MASPSDLCHRAELFRSKLIAEFQLLESIDGAVQAPMYHSNEITDEQTLKKILTEAPQQLVKFKVYRSDRAAGEEEVDRRLTRVKNKNKLPLGVWARSIVYDGRFQNFMLYLIVINSVALGIQSELSDAVNSGKSSLSGLVVAVDMFEYFCLFSFVLEIILKWLDDFFTFWKNGWNIFDFVITVLSSAPEFISILSGDESSSIATTAKQLKVFRIMRSLKMVARFGSLKIIVLTILQTFQTMAFIMLLLFIVAFVFAIVAIVVFEPLSKSQRTDLQYKDSFTDLPRALGTLFQLFTLDHWYAIYKDVTKVIDPTLTAVFIIMWVWVGAFLFRNIFVGIMVNNFTSISELLQQQSLDHHENLEMQMRRETLNQEILKQEAQRQGEAINKTEENVDDFPAGLASTSESQTALLRKRSRQLFKEQQRDDEWAKTVRENLQALASDPGETYWPRDSLFRYFQIMEELQETLQEYRELQHLAVTSLLKLHDT